MSWITRCPDCDTVYKVAGEQLQQAHGWLRCGACQHVFDSTGRVVAADVIPTLNERVNVGAPQLGRVDLERLLHKESPGPAAPLASEAPEPTGSEPSAVTAFDEALQSFKLPDLPAAPNPTADAAAQDALVEDAPAEASEPVAAAPVASAPRSASPAARWALFVLALLLACQALLAARPWLVVHWPQAARMAAQWCETPTCRAQWQAPLSGWMLQAEIKASEGTPPRLSWSLRHSAAEALSVPDLALVLLQADAQPLPAQRLSADMTAAPATLGAGQVWQGTLPLDLSADATATGAQLRLQTR